MKTIKIRWYSSLDDVKESLQLHYRGISHKAKRSIFRLCEHKQMCEILSQIPCCYIPGKPFLIYGYAFVIYIIKNCNGLICEILQAPSGRCIIKSDFDGWGESAAFIRAEIE